MIQKIGFFDQLIEFLCVIGMKFVNEAERKKWTENMKKQFLQESCINRVIYTALSYHNREYFFCAIKHILHQNLELVEQNKLLYKFLFCTPLKSKSFSEQFVAEKIPSMILQNCLDSENIFKYADENLFSSIFLILAFNRHTHKIVEYVSEDVGFELIHRVKIINIWSETSSDKKRYGRILQHLDMLICPDFDFCSKFYFCNTSPKEEYDYLRNSFREKKRDVECSTCGKNLLSDTNFCAKCHTVAYFSKKCQKKHWKKCHKKACKHLKYLAENSKYLINPLFQNDD